MRRVGALVALAVALAAGGGSASRAAAPSTATLDLYGGLGAWVDIFDGGVLADPDAAIAVMAEHGVGTVFVETSNSTQPTDLVRAWALGRLVDAAHASGIRVVAWYLPTLVSPARDLRRSLAALSFRSESGGSFDSFAFDVESSAVRRVALRNARLLALVRRVRAAAPAGYPLAAIVPSPVGMQLHPTYWPRFPWVALAGEVNAFVPMAYYTYRARTAADVYLYATQVVADIREATGDPAVPIHLVGGIANRTSPAAAAAFVRAASDCGVAGTSLYDFATTSTRIWGALDGFDPVADSAC